MAYLGEYHLNSNTLAYYKFDNNLNDSSGAGLTLSNSGADYSFDRLKIGSHSLVGSGAYLFRNDTFLWSMHTNHTYGFWFSPVKVDATNDLELFYSSDGTYYKGAIAMMIQYSSKIIVWPRIYRYDSGSTTWTDSSGTLSLAEGKWYFILLRYLWSVNYYYLYLYVYQNKTEVGAGSPKGRWEWNVVSEYVRVASFTGSSTSLADYFRIFPASYSDQYYAIDELFIESGAWGASPVDEFIPYWQQTRGVRTPRCS